MWSEIWINGWNVERHVLHGDASFVIINIQNLEIEIWIDEIEIQESEIDKFEISVQKIQKKWNSGKFKLKKKWNLRKNWNSEKWKFIKN